MDIVFKITGRDKCRWKRAVTHLDYSWVIQEIIQHSSLLTSSIDIAYDDKENMGLIFSGKDVAGSFSVEEEMFLNPSI